MKKGDICLIVIAVIFLALWFIPPEKGGEAAIYVDGELYKSISLDENTEVTVNSKFGKNTVAIKDGEVYITHADCPDRLCEKEKLSSSGGSIVCLPNRLSVVIEGKKTDEKIDVVI